MDLKLDRNKPLTPQIGEENLVGSVLGVAERYAKREEMKEVTLGELENMKSGYYMDLFGNLAVVYSGNVVVVSEKGIRLDINADVAFPAIGGFSKEVNMVGIMFWEFLGEL